MYSTNPAADAERHFEEQDEYAEVVGDARSSVIYTLRDEPKSSVIDLELMDSDAVLSALGQLLKVFADCEDTGRDAQHYVIAYAARKLYAAAMEHAL